MRNVLSTGCFLLLAAVTPPEIAGAPILDGPTTSWNSITLISNNPVDYLDDQQTGSGESDIVGTLPNPGLYFSFDDAGTESLTDGTLAFRVRLGSDLPDAGTFGSALLVGIDGNGDGALDIFVGVDNRGSTGLVKIWNAGTDTNTSPSTTSIASPDGQFTYAETAANYSYILVTALTDPNATTFDLDGDGVTDRFLSFSVPFEDVVTEAQRLRGLTIDQSSPLRYVVVTSTQDNAFNQDLGGVDGGIGSSSTWTELGAISNESAPDVPEPGTYVLVLSSFSALVLLRRRRSGQ